MSKENFSSSFKKVQEMLDQLLDVGELVQDTSRAFDDMFDEDIIMIPRAILGLMGCRTMDFMVKMINIVAIEDYMMNGEDSYVLYENVAKKLNISAEDVDKAFPQEPIKCHHKNNQYFTGHKCECDMFSNHSHFAIRIRLENGRKAIKFSKALASEQFESFEEE